MIRVSSPAEVLRLSQRMTSMLAEAQMVMGMRFLGMAGLWRVGPSENAQMVAEKFAAVQESALAAGKAAIRGASAAAIADQALQPIQRRTRSNARRLSGN